MFSEHTGTVEQVVVWGGREVAEDEVSREASVSGVVAPDGTLSTKAKRSSN